MFKHIVATFVDSPEGGRALQAAITLALENGSELHIVAVVGDPPPSSGFARAVSPAASRLIDDDQTRFAEELKSRATQQATGKGLTVSASQVAGHLVEGVLDIARQRGADLLVVGLQRPTLHIARLWNKVSELAEESPCSVLGIP